ncbi:unnamed protein product [Polarella glacialis]|uniref:Peptidase S1 domain-containing protein n=1 Tax=Polarella glacialis TaxID=89957 RepID=A0A813LWU4_POLGL|nr:unnamed protein product [Polarella glacialis]
MLSHATETRSLSNGTWEENIGFQSWGNHPWLVAISLSFYYEAGDPAAREVCTGSRISSEWVLTAAHCFDRCKLGGNEGDWTEVLSETYHGAAVVMISSTLSDLPALRMWILSTYPEVERDRLLADGRPVTPIGAGTRTGVDIALINLGAGGPAQGQFVRLMETEERKQEMEKLIVQGQTRDLYGWGFVEPGVRPQDRDLVKYAVPSRIALPIIFSGNTPPPMYFLSHPPSYPEKGDSGGPFATPEGLQVGVLSGSLSAGATTNSVWWTIPPTGAICLKCGLCNQGCLDKHPSEWPDAKPQFEVIDGVTKDTADLTVNWEETDIGDF